MFKGLLGGMLTGGLVSVAALSGASLLNEPPVGVRTAGAPLAEAPTVDEVPQAVADNPSAVDEAADGVAAPQSGSSPVGSLEIVAPQAPDLPGSALIVEPEDVDSGVSVEVPTEPEAPRADTDPLDEPVVGVIEGTMAAPEAPETSDVLAQPVDPVLPNPQAMAPETPDSESDLTVSTAPAAAIIVVEPDVAQDTEAVEAGDTIEAPVVAGGEATDEVSDGATDDFFVVDLAANAPDDTAREAVETAPRIALQGSENTLLSDRETGVTIRRPGVEEEQVAAGDDGAAVSAAGPALSAYAADRGDLDGRPLMSIVLVDDGSMSAARAALAGLSFPITIALDPAAVGAAERMVAYRAAGFEVVVLAKLPEGALPSDVEVTFEAVFSTLPESVAVLDLGDGGLQSDRAVTEQAMSILSQQGRGFISASAGLNMAGRAAEQAGVPAAVIYRDLDGEDQDARVVRRFVDQAAFRARQESGVVLVGRVRPDTISALILWGTANQDEQVAIVPVSAVLSATN